MTPAQIDGLTAFLLGLGIGVLVQWAVLEVERRCRIRRRLQMPPFTTEGQGR